MKQDLRRGIEWGREGTSERFFREILGALAPHVLGYPQNEVFTLPHLFQPESGRTVPDTCVTRIQIFLVKMRVFVRSLSGHNSGHFPAGQFVRRTFRPDSPWKVHRK